MLSATNPTVIAAILYNLAIIAVIGFQIALIVGAPWGHLTQGGQRQGPLPVSGRTVAGLSIPLLLLMGASIASIAGLPPHLPAWTIWIALGLQMLSMLLNWITRSRHERILWGPITTLMFALAAYTAVTAS